MSGAIVLWCTAFASTAWADPPTGLAGEDDPPLAPAYAGATDRAAEWIEAGKLRDADKLLDRLQAKVGRPAHPRVDGLVALLKIEQGDIDGAWRAIEKRVEMNEGYRPQRFECCLAAGKVHTARGDFDRAIAMFEWVLVNETGERLRRRGLVREQLAETHAAAERYGKAVGSLESAIGEAEQLLAKLRYMDEPDAATRMWIKRMRERLGALRLEWDKQRYGEDYVAFRAADRLRLAGRHAEAVKAYRALIDASPESPFAAASAVNEGVSLIRLGATAMAKRRLSAFVESDEHAPHRGAALSLIASVALEHELDTDASVAAYERLREWIVAVRTEAGPPEPRTVPEAALAVVRPAQPRDANDLWGRPDPAVTTTAGVLLNRSTAAWHLDDLEIACLQRLALLRIVTRETDAAVEALNRLAELDPRVRRLESQDRWNDFRRLMYGARRGRLIAREDELAAFGQRGRLLVMLGDFYYVTGRFDEAAAHFERVLAGRYGGVNGKQRDYALWAQANAVAWRHGRDAALPLFEKVIADADGTSTEQRAALTIALVESQRPELDRRRRGLAMLERVMHRSGETKVSAGARLALARAMWRIGDVERAADLLHEMPSDSGAYASAAGYYLDQWKADLPADRR